MHRTSSPRTSHEKNHLTTSQGELSPTTTSSHKASIVHSKIEKKNLDTQKDQHIVTVTSENYVPNVSTMYNHDEHARVSLHDAPVDINSTDTNIARPKTTHYSETNLGISQPLYPNLGANGYDQDLDNIPDLPFSDRLQIFKYGSEDPNLNQHVDQNSLNQLPESLNFKERRETKQGPPPYSFNDIDKTPLNSAPDHIEHLVQTSQKQAQELKDLTAAGTLLQLQHGSLQVENQATSTYLPNLSTANNPFYSTQAPVDQVSRALWPDFNLANSYPQAIGHTSDTQHSPNHTQDNTPDTDMASAVRFDTFGGRTDEDYHAWRKHTERNFVFLNWDDRKCAAYLPTLLQDKALRYYETLPPTSTASTASVFEALTNKFSTAAKGMLQINKLLERNQGETESVEEYSRYIINNFSSLGIADEFTKITHFVAGLKPHLRAEVIKANPKTLEEVENAAMLAELACRQTTKLADKVEKVLMFNNTHPQKRPPQQKPFPSDPNNNRFCGRCQRRHPYGMHTKAPNATQTYWQPNYQPNYRHMRPQYVANRPNTPNFTPSKPNWRPQRPNYQGMPEKRSPMSQTNQTTQQNRQSFSCYNCHEQGHFSRNCPKRLN